MARIPSCFGSAFALTALGIATLPLLAIGEARSDEFDRYGNSVMEKLDDPVNARQVESLSFADLVRADQVLANETGTFVIVRTNDGNWSKLILRPGFRKHGDQEVPILIVERYYTLRRDSESGRRAAGKKVYLFPGFQFNLDIGQVVPAEGGGDLQFQSENPESGSLVRLGKARFYLPLKPLLPKQSNAVPLTGPVTSASFTGKYQLYANGQWSGKLTLKAEASGQVAGSYISDQSGRDYPVRGLVARPPHRIRFVVELPQTDQEFDGFLWTKGRGVIAGTTTLLEQSFGFVAVREGTQLQPREKP